MKIHKFQGLALSRFLINTAVYSLLLSLFLWLLREETSNLEGTHFLPLESSQKQKQRHGGFGGGWSSGCVEEMMSPQKEVGQLSLECGGHQG